MNSLPPATPQSVRYWANRFGEHCNEGLAGFPGAARVDELVERLYPHNANGIETAHLVTLDGELGVLLEYEFADDYIPCPAVAAHWRMAAPAGARFLAYSGFGSFNDCWQFAAFVPAATEANARGFVERCADLLAQWGPRA